MNFEGVKAYIFERLGNELPDFIEYHDLDHSVRVLAAAETLAESEGIQGSDLQLLKTAAVLHDCGFLVGQKEHELSGCQIAQDLLPDYGYSEEQIDAICEIIMSTKVPQNPVNHLCEIICDADLDYLGTDLFFDIGNRLFSEFKFFGIIQNEEDWNRLQVRFMESHTYFTHSAKELREVAKRINLQKVKEIVNTYEELSAPQE